MEPMEQQLMEQQVNNEATVSQQEEELKKYEKPIGEHILELRKRLLYCILAVTILFFVIFGLFADSLMALVTAPVKERGIQFIYVGLAEALGAQMKVCLICAVVVSAPILFWNIWSFVKPALYENERRYVMTFTFISLLLFTLGVVFGYVVVFLSAITFFVYVGQDFATPMLSISDYVSFLLGFVIPFGCVFEMPIVSYILSRMWIVDSAMLIAFRKYVVLVIFIVAAILTPPDVLSQVLMALPMIILYEIGIVVVKITEKKA